jgi:transposase
VVLRHQLAILRRGGKRPQYTTGDRALLAAASRLLPPERWSCFAVSPQTLRRWHRALLQGGGRRRRGRRLGRPPLAAATHGLIRRLARENPRWGYVRIQGELLKLGISVSATTIATALRSSGLGPAPRRIGPTWSEFLRAQAQSMLGSGLSSAVGDDALGGVATEPSGSADVGPDRQVEADKRSPADAAEPRLASHPLHLRSRSSLPRPRVLVATRGPSLLPPSHRSHARDGPRKSSPASSHSPVLTRDVKATAGRARGPHKPRVGSARGLPGSSAPSRRRNQSTSSPSLPAGTDFLYPAGSFSGRGIVVSLPGAAAAAGAACAADALGAGEGDRDSRPASPAAAARASGGSAGSARRSGPAGGVQSRVAALGVLVIRCLASNASRPGTAS